MQEYYLFIIKPQIAKIYEDNLKDLYNNLYEIYNNKYSNLNYSLSLFEQLCKPFKVKVINDYFSHLSYLKKNNVKYLYKSEKEVSLIFLSYSVIVIKSNSCYPHFFNLLTLFNQRVLVCNFLKPHYFWLINKGA